ncbi:DUF1648 domain-containing protein [Mesonia sp. K7]|uniref:DUF1648 domain-containing protein n=1 Tax=Mesonia sp. K7 TaxID=2218606 RepID=UPI000DA775DD|nr:DUF1648 domain-containing protein [Mesonia sp. K7]PZD79607.1 hypothetical protein DNG35_00960 [Mesonia sp. K7]
MKNRPRLQIPLKRSDYIIESLCLLALAGIWFLAFYKYHILPEEIPTHYNGSGKADAFGSKEYLITLPIVATVLYLFLSIFQKFPHMYNYMVKITEANAYRQYQLATRMMRILKLCCVLIFAGIIYLSVESTLNKTYELNGWFIPVIIILPLVPLIYYFNASSKHEK